MDYPLPVVSDDGDLSWSDSHSMDSDDGQPMMVPNHSPSWMDHLPSSAASMSVSSTMSISHTGQLSPISNGMDIPGAQADGSSGHSSTPTMIHSAASSSTDSWGMDYVESDELDDMDDIAGIGNSGMDAEIHWEQAEDDLLTIPKLEPLDDDELLLGALKEAPATFLPADGAVEVPVKVKRPRGRPRKHPLPPIVATNKITKGRSKTGCITCRKRKKKCDEAKPRCKSSLGPHVKSASSHRS